MDSFPSHSGRLPDGSSWYRDPASITRTSSSAVVESLSFGGSGSQSLASILNNPQVDTSWSVWWPSAATTYAFPDPPPVIIPATPLPIISSSDFQTYISLISDSYSKFEDVRNHASKENADSEIRGQGGALVACLREVPSLFFKEDFALEEGEMFQAACPFSPLASENVALQEKLSQYLDVVEMHLVKEISLRSNSFFEAQGQLQGLDREIVETCARIRELKEMIRILNMDLVDSAKEVQSQNATRCNLVGLHQKLTVILYVSQALSALKLLVASADCASALDVIDDLQHMLDCEELTGLHCFRHLRDHLTESLNSIHSILSMEFMHVARHATNGGNNLDLLIQQGIKSRPDNVINGLDDEVTLDDDESSILRDRLLPLIIGLLRTAKLPSVLRIYRDTLISDMKTSIKSTVAELLPVLVSRPLDIDSTVSERQLDTDGGSLSLASKLRSLSPKNFVLLLIAIFNVVQAHLVRAAEVKRVIEWIMGNLDGCDAADSVAAAVALGAAAAAAAESSQETDVQIITSLTNSFPKNTSRVSSMHMKINKASSPTTTTNFRTDVLRENTEAVFSACDAAHGRWAKLLGVRALIHPKLRLQEFLSIYNITQDFITTTEKIGGRLGYSIRGTLQSQSKSFVDFQHDFRITKIKAILDQETWVLVDVPKEFQNIIDSLSSLVLSNVHDSRVEVGFPGNDSVESSIVSIGPVIESSMDSEVKVNNNNNSNGIASGHGKSASQTIVYKGVGYHMVNCGLIMVKMLSEYIDICKFLPTLSSEVVHRVVEFLKVFNTRTCQLVLGAGAMQVSGLKSITSKHLALASQITSFIYTIIPDIRKVLFLKIPESRRGLLLFEIDRVAQDYKVHRDEIHSKLVQIMRERLLANLRKLPQIVETWNNPEDNEPQPSQFARSVTKEVSYLHRILSQILLETDVKIIFRQVVQIFHSHISEAFSNIEIKSQQAKIRLHRDVQHILGCIRKLPSDDSDGAQLSNQGLLDEFLTSKIGKIES